MLCFFRYYRDGFHCKKCDKSCEVCSGPGPEFCKACPPPLLELQGTKLCVERCHHRFYQVDEMCKQCHTSCQTCTGRKDLSVYFCCLFLFYWLLSCNVQVSIFDILFGVLEMLSDRVYSSVFIDSSPQGCVTCDWGSTLKDNVCYPRCEEGQYFSHEVCFNSSVNINSLEYSAFKNNAPRIQIRNHWLCQLVIDKIDIFFLLIIWEKQVS